MNHIEKLRAVKHRVGPELSSGQRQTTLPHLDDEMEALDAQLNAEHACCAEMQNLIAKMHARVRDMRQRVADSDTATKARSGAES